MLMRTAQAAAQVTPPSPIAPQIILEEAHAKTNVKVGNLHLTMHCLEHTTGHEVELFNFVAGHINRLHPSTRR